MHHFRLPSLVQYSRTFPRCVLPLKSTISKKYNLLRVSAPPSVSRLWRPNNNLAPSTSFTYL